MSSRFFLSMALAVVLTVPAPVGATASSVVEPPPGPAGWLFDPGTVVEIDLGLPQESIEILEKEPEKEYQPATFSLTAGGHTYGPLNVGARLKGGIGSFKPLSGKAAFKVKFDEFVDEQTFFGLEKLTLNNMVQDPTMMRETLAYEAFRSVGVAAPRTGYAFVRVNGEAFGLYLNVETLDAISLPRWFASTQHLYEGSYGADVTPGGAEDFEVDEGKSKNRADLEALIAATNDEVGDWSDGVAGFADLDQMTRMWAVERYLGHWDGYAGELHPLSPNNYYLHSDADDLFRMLPWGTDQTWGLRVGFGEDGAGLLFARCLADTSCAATYRDAAQQAGSAIAGLNVDAHIDALAAQLAPCQALEVEPRREYTAAEIEEGIEGLRGFAAERPGELAEWLGLPSDPAAGGPPFSAGVQPCSSSDPQSESESLAASVPPGPAIATKTDGKLRIGAPRVLGAAIATPIELPHGGRVAQRVAIQAGRGWRTACVNREVRDAAGSLTMRCALSKAIWRRLSGGPLALRVRIDFMPFGGGPKSTLRRLSVPTR
ncbi:MAG: CotH kinase family protein [Solirubrobacterales bacterium]